MQIIRTILIIFIVYYGFRLLFRYVLPFFFKRWINNKVGQYQYQGGNVEQERANAKKKEGEVHIRSRSTSKKSETDGIGDYIDYEEVNQ